MCLYCKLLTYIFQFAGFSSDSFAERILDCEARVVVTADGVWRGEKLLQLKSICDHAMDKCSKEGHNVETCIVVSHLERVSSPKGGSQTRQTNKVIERLFFSKFKGHFHQSTKIQFVNEYLNKITNFGNH